MPFTFDISSQLFSLGTIISTPGARRACSSRYLMECLRRHARGDWGHVLPETAAALDHALLYGEELCSLYKIDPPQPADGEPGNALYVITDAGRSTTTLLLPEEYDRP